MFGDGGFGQTRQDSACIVGKKRKERKKNKRYTLVFATGFLSSRGPDPMQMQVTFEERCGAEGKIGEGASTYPDVRSKSSLEDSS